MNRFDRITAILVQLHTRRVVRAQDIAERFGISLRTVYRDIRSLEEAGVPIEGEAGVGYALMAGYRLPPVLFTKEEAIALVTAEKIVDKLTDPSTREHYQLALDKVKAVLQSKDKELLERIGSSIQVIKGGDSLAGPAALQPLLAAIAEQKVVEISYQAYGNEAAQSRPVEPVGLFQHGSHWYLIAYCRLRQAYRTFRTDRIEQLAILTERYKAVHPTLSEYLAEVSRQRQLEKVVIEVKTEVARYIEGSRHNYGFITEDRRPGWVEMTFLTPSLEGLARWMLMFADAAEVKEPAALESRLKALAEGLAKKYAEAESLLT